MKSVKKENLGIPYMVEGYGYLVDKNLLKDLFALDDAGPLLTDLKTCDYQEFRDFTNAVNDYIRDGSAHTIRSVSIPTFIRLLAAILVWQEE